MVYSSLYSFIRLQFRAECSLLYQSPLKSLYPFCFLILAVSLFPISLGADAVQIGQVAVPIFWVLLLFLVTLSLEELFEEDWQTGLVEQYLLTPDFFITLIYIQLILFCLRILIVTTLLMPCLIFALYLPVNIWGLMILSIWLVVPTLVFLGAMGRVLTIALPQSIFLVMLILFPLYFPALIFASSAITLATHHLSAKGPFAWLGLLLILSMSVAPWAIRKIFQWSVILL